MSIHVEPVSPVAPYIGGKRFLAATIIQRISTIPHTLYAEPFVGMGGIFLRRSRLPEVEVINDASCDVTTLFRILQRHYTPFVEMLRYQLTTRTDFQRLAATDPATLTDLERAARFLYLQRLAFGGKVSGRNFGLSASAPARFDTTKLAPMLEDLHERLAGVVIECLPWQDFLTRYDRPGALFYLDPPYYGCEGDYGPLFSRSEFNRMATLLATIQGRFLLSLNDVPAVREIFQAFSLEPVSTTYTISGSAQTTAELLISNCADLMADPLACCPLFNWDAESAG